MKRYKMLQEHQIEINIMKPYQTRVGTWGVYDGEHYHYFDDQGGRKNSLTKQEKLEK
jgi:hypothetical protein